MKKKPVILLLLGIVLGKSIPALGLDVFLGATYNPLNPNYIMGAALLDASLGKHFIWESRFAFGSLTYNYEAPNPFTVEGETAQLWAKSYVMETTTNFVWQYTIKDAVGLRFGFGFPLFWSSAFGGEKPGLSGEGMKLGLTAGANGIFGVALFPQKKFPVLLTVAPGVILNFYSDNNGQFPFNLPISLLVGMNLLRM
jgi:hypothetical protein